MSVERKFHLALDETRMAVLGAQILLGFELQAVFRDGFDALRPASKTADAVGLLLMVLALGLLLAPQALHRIGDRGEVTGYGRMAVGRFMSLALAPFGLSLGIDIFIIVDRTLGGVAAWSAALALGLFAAFGWYAWGYVYRAIVIGGKRTMKRGTASTLEEKIDEMLTEARIALPGAQALLGFQLLAVLNKPFDALPMLSKEIHVVAMLLVALAMTILVTPAALHRIAFDGEDDQRFFRMGSRLVTAALAPLLLGICGDVYVAVAKVMDSAPAGAVCAVGCLIVLTGLWYGYPLAYRMHEQWAKRA